MNLVPDDDPILRRAADAIGSVTVDVFDLAADMIRLLRKHKALGLAAPQVGVGWRMFVTVELPRSMGDSPYLVHINPEVVSASGRAIVENEGCLSLPGRHVRVARADKITVRERLLVLPSGHDEFVAGQLVERELQTFHARVFLHEFDHLNGVLMTDREHP